jgi:hypothetical protein
MISFFSIRTSDGSDDSITALSDQPAHRLRRLRALQSRDRKGAGFDTGAVAPGQQCSPRVGEFVSGLALVAEIYLNISMLIITYAAKGYGFNDGASRLPTIMNPGHPDN